LRIYTEVILLDALNLTLDEVEVVASSITVDDGDDIDDSGETIIVDIE
jgi:hypothetical protein